MQHESDDQHRPERRLSEREGRANRQPLAKVVQTDTGRHHLRQDPAAPRRRPGVAPPRAQPVTNHLEPDESRQRAKHEQRHTLERARRECGGRKPIVPRVDQQVQQQPDRQRD